MSMDITPELLRKYAQGTCTTEEREAVLQWLSSTGNEDSSLPESQLYEVEHAMWDNISRDLPGFEQEKRVPLWGTLRRCIPYAAAVALIITATVVVRHLGEPVFRENATTAIQQLSIKTEKGKKVVATLPDGTEVFLNAGSELEYPEKFSDTSRIAILRGEAYFNVMRDTLRPFRVITARANVTVLGTSFNVKSFSEENVTTVTVEEGKVKVSVNDTERFVVLTADMQAIVDDRSHLTSGMAAFDTYGGWKENRLILKDQPLSAIAPLLERWYNVTVIIHSQKLKDRRFTGRYDNPSLQNLMKEMSMVMNFHYELNDRVLHIR